MDKLRGKSFLIGKEPASAKLMLALEGSGKACALGPEGSVPNTVSRCKPAEGVAHAKITVDPQGRMTLVNLKPQNVTYVNGKQIESKRITEADSISLGRDRYTVSLPIILDYAKKLVGAAHPAGGSVQAGGGFSTHGGGSDQPGGAGQAGHAQPPKPKYNISHLKKVWDDYEREQEEIVKKQQAMNRRKMLPIMIGSFSGLASPVLIAMELTSPLFFTVPIAAISFGLYFINYRQKDTSFEDRKAAQENFTDHYVCPNPDCNKFFGNLSYRLLKRQYNMNCPFCKCDFVEK